MLWVLLILAAGLALAALGAALIARVALEGAATWGPDRWEARLCVRGWRGAWVGYGALGADGGTFGMKLAGVRVVERRAGGVLARVGRAGRSWWDARREGRGPGRARRGPVQVSIYAGLLRRVLRAFRSPHVCAEGTYCLADPCTLGQAAGWVYGAGALVREACPGSCWDLHPDFTGGPASGALRLSVSLRPIRLLPPGLWALGQALGRRRKKQTGEGREGGHEHG